MDTRPTFANLVTRSGKTMAQIARDSGLSLSTISRLASGDRLPSITTLVGLAKAIGVPVDAVADACIIQREARDEKETAA